MRLTQTAENRKERASATTASGAPRVCAIAPPAAGAVISAISDPAASLLLPSTNWSRGTIVGKNDGSATSNSTRKIPLPAATRYNCSICRVPNAQASGTEASKSARPRSAIISRGRRRKRSTQTPAIRPKSSTGAALTAPSRPIWPAVACTTSRAVSPNAPSCEPKSDMILAVQSLTKSGFCQSSAARSFTAITKISLLSSIALWQVLVDQLLHKVAPAVRAFPLGGGLRAGDDVLVTDTLVEQSQRGGQRGGGDQPVHRLVAGPVFQVAVAQPGVLGRVGLQMPSVKQR